ncbi:MAG: hypothetical protein U5M53_06140 [Rhodoferax sp.]|nr:hypothetical protein [Rhodoferax sp.]
MTAVTPILIAIFVAWIAFQQYRIGRDKLRLDLYQRRFSVYEKTLYFHHLLSGSVEQQKSEAFSKTFRDFITAYRESQFLFESSSGIFPLLEEFHAKAFKVIGFKQHGESLIADPVEFLKLKVEAQEALEFFPKALEILEKSIAPYLNFRRVLV